MNWEPGGKSWPRWIVWGTGRLSEHQATRLWDSEAGSTSWTSVVRGKRCHPDDQGVVSALRGLAHSGSGRDLRKHIVKRVLSVWGCRDTAWKEVIFELGSLEWIYHMEMVGKAFQAKSQQDLHLAQENAGSVRNKRSPLVLVGRRGQALTQYLKLDSLSIKEPLRVFQEKSNIRWPCTRKPTLASAHRWVRQ